MLFFLVIHRRKDAGYVLLGFALLLQMLQSMLHIAGYCDVPQVLKPCELCKLG